MNGRATAATSDYEWGVGGLTICGALFVASVRFSEPPAVGDVPGAADPGVGTTKSVVAT
jgi:hypothetical protein